MHSGLRSLLLQSAFAALISLPPLSTAAATTLRQSDITCTVNDLWESDAPLTHAALTVPVAATPIEAAYGFVAPAISEQWAVTYKSTGADRLRGAARDRVLRHGVLWWVNPADLGVSENEAISALLRSGAVISRPEGDGRVYYRAREENALKVAEKAAKLLGSDRSVAVYKEGVQIAGATEASVGGAFQASPGLAPGNARLDFSTGLKADVAMLRLEGRLSRSPLQFIEFIPAGMTVMSFGTSFVVHVTAAGFPALRDYIEQEGNSVLLVGASGPVQRGAESGRLIRYCGGNFLADRFPTPVVSSLAGPTASIDVEGQSLSVADGDTVLVVQKPLYGRGLEIAVMRFGG